MSNGAAGSAGPSSYEAFYHFELDIISTDLTVHKFNMPPYAKNLPLVISKYLALGMDLMAIFEKATVNPARLMGLEGQIGTMVPGALANIAIFEEREKHYIQRDYCDDKLECSRMILVPLMTMIAGEIQYCRSDFYF